MTGTLRIATWNIHGAIGADGLCLPDRIERVVAEIGADIVALQEIDGRTHLGRRARAFETFRELLGGHIVEARLIGPPGREHGHILWSRRPFMRHSVHLLPGGLEQRGLIEAELAMPGGAPLRLFATHLGLSPVTRIRQIRAAGRLLDASAAPAILLGDLNEWMPRGAVHHRLSKSLPDSLRPRTWPARRPFAPLDRIYASAGVTLTERDAPQEAAGASDHLPVVAEIAIASPNAVPAAEPD